MEREECEKNRSSAEMVFSVAKGICEGKKTVTVLSKPENEGGRVC